MTGPGAASRRRLDRAAELVATYGVAVLILALPLEFTSAWLRQQLSRYVLAVIVLAFVYLLIARRTSIVLPRNPSLWLLAAYVVFSLSSALVTRAPGSFNSVLDVVAYPLVGLLIANLVRNETDHRRAWIAFLVSALAIAVLGVVLYVAHASIWNPNPLVAARLNITFGDPNITARFLTLGACAAVLMFSGRQGPAWLSTGTAVACAAVLPLTLSRSGLGLLVATLLLAVVVALNRRRAAAIGLVALLAFAISTGANPDTRQRAADAMATVVSAVTGKPASVGGPAGASHSQDASGDNRTYLVAAGLKMFSDHPVLGVGFGGYQHALLTDYRRFLPANRSGANLDSLSHAALVTVLAEQGLTGTLLFLAFLALVAREAWQARQRRDEWALWSTIPATLMIPIFVYSQIEGRFLSEPYFWLALGLMYSAQRAAASARSAEPRAVEWIAA